MNDVGISTLRLETLDYYAVVLTTADSGSSDLVGASFIKHELICINIHITAVCIAFKDRSTIIKRIKEVGCFIACILLSLEVIIEEGTWGKVQIIKQ